jgi:hypothetical protein
MFRPYGATFGDYVHTSEMVKPSTCTSESHDPASLHVMVDSIHAFLT